MNDYMRAQKARLAATRANGRRFVGIEADCDRRDCERVGVESVREAGWEHPGWYCREHAAEAKAATR